MLQLIHCLLDCILLSLNDVMLHGEGVNWNLLDVANCDNSECYLCCKTSNSLLLLMLNFYIQVSKAHSWTCMDLYVFATPYRVTWDYYFISREHTLDFKEWQSEAEFEYVSWICFSQDFASML